MYLPTEHVQDITYSKPFLIRYRVLFIILAAISLSWLIMLTVLTRPVDQPEPFQQLHPVAPQDLDWQEVSPVNIHMAPLLIPPTYTVTKNTESIFNIEKSPHSNPPVTLSFQLIKDSTEDSQDVLSPSTVQRFLQLTARVAGGDIREGSILLNGNSVKYDMLGGGKDRDTVYEMAFYGTSGHIFTTIIAKVSSPADRQAVQELNGILYGFAFN